MPEHTGTVDSVRPICNCPTARHAPIASEASAVCTFDPADLYLEREISGDRAGTLQALGAHLGLQAQIEEATADARFAPSTQSDRAQVAATGPNIQLARIPNLIGMLQ